MTELTYHENEIWHRLQHGGIGEVKAINDTIGCCETVALVVDRAITTATVGKGDRTLPGAFTLCRAEEMGVQSCGFCRPSA
jgi:hypothetical protein